MTDDYWTAVPKRLPPGYMIGEVRINGSLIEGVHGTRLAMQLWNAGATRAMRRLYRHHLPRRLWRTQ